MVPAPPLAAPPVDPSAAGPHADAPPPPAADPAAEPAAEYADEHATEYPAEHAGVAERAERTEWDRQRSFIRSRLLGVPACKLGLPRSRWHSVMRLLRAVLWYDCRGKGCWTGRERLAAEADLSIASLQRAKRDAVRLGLLLVERRPNHGPGGGRLPDRLMVDLAAVAPLVGPQPARESPTPAAAAEAAAAPARRRVDAGSVPPAAAPAAGGDASAAVASDRPAAASSCGLSAHAEPATAQREPATAHAEPASAQGARSIKEYPEELPRTKTPPQPPPAGACDPGAAGGPQGEGLRKAWRVVEEELFLCGVNQARAAVAAALRAGATPAEVHAVVAHWRPRRAAWGPHAEAVLMRRVQRQSRGRPAWRAWPAYDPQAPRGAAQQLDEQQARLHAERAPGPTATQRRWWAAARLLTDQQQVELGGLALAQRPDLRGAPGERIFYEAVVPMLESWGVDRYEAWRVRTDPGPQRKKRRRGGGAGV